MAIRLFNPSSSNTYEGHILEGEAIWTLYINEVKTNAVYHLGHYVSREDAYAALLGMMAANNWTANELDSEKVRQQKAIEDFYDNEVG